MFTCGAELRGRSDHKYCVDACRTSANNRIRYEEIRNGVDNFRTVNYFLNRNYCILASLIKRGAEFSTMYLRDRGFNFRHFTRMEQKEGDTINYCYDYGYVVGQDSKRLLS